MDPNAEILWFEDDLRMALPDQDEDSSGSDDENNRNEPGDADLGDDVVEEEPELEIVDVGPYNNITFKFPGVVNGAVRNILRQLAECLPSSVCKPGHHILLECPLKQERLLSLLTGVLEFVHRQSTQRRVYFGVKSFADIQQLLDLLNRFKETGYLAGIKVAVLGSQSHLCINPEVVKNAKTVPIADACNKLVGPVIVSANNPGQERMNQPKCRFYKVHPPVNGLTFNYVDENHCVHDIEDFKSQCRQQKTCPYFHSKDVLYSTANFIFCPLEFLVSSTLRTRYGIQLKDSIVIVDDANSVLKVLTDEGSFTGGTSWMKRTAVKWEAAAKAVEAENPSHLTKITTDAVKQFATAWKAVCDWCDKYAIGEPRDPTKPQKEKLISETTKALRASFEENGITSSRAVGTISNHVTKIQESLRNCSNFEVELDSATIETTEKLLTALRHQFHSFETKTFTHYMDVTSYNGKTSFHIICSSPAVTFQSFTESASTVILSSGCLPPVQVLGEELGGTFPHRILIEDQEDTQTFMVCCPQGPNAVELQLNHNNKNRSVVQDELGEALLQIFEVIPENTGILVLFPSIPLLDATLAQWDNGENRTASIMSQMKASLHVFDERNKSKPDDAKRVTEKFLERCDQPLGELKGAVLFALHRGKCHDLVDFSKEVKVIVHCGIPYASRKASNVKAKVEYFKEKEPEDHSKREGEVYNAEAFHIISESFARLVKHKPKWAALIVLDQRMVKKKDDFPQLLPAWICSKTRCAPEFSELAADFKRFIRDNCVVAVNQQNDSDDSF